jgi:Uma2 family endonuclease
MSIASVPNADASFAILELFPRQGEWREGDYFSLPGNRMMELVDGHVEILPVPSLLHQFLARLVFLQLHEFVERHSLGIVMSAPTRIRISDRHFREPDVLFVSAANLHRRQAQFWEIANLVVEIISPDDADRDLIDKRHDYATAGIAEYWIIDPRDDSIQVFYLRDGAYSDGIRMISGQSAESKILSGFRTDVAELFARARA